MRKVTLTVTALLIIAASSYGGSEGTTAVAASDGQTCPACGYENPPAGKYCVNCGAALPKKRPARRGPRLGIGGYYLIGTPRGELTASELVGSGITLDIEMEDGIPFKTGPANFGAGIVFNIIRYLGVEGVIEVHTGYKNKESYVQGTWDIPPGEFYWREAENNITWSMTNFYFGARANIPTGTLFEPFGGGGLLISMNSLNPDGRWRDRWLAYDRDVRATNMGLYFGGGANFFVTRKIAITVPFKYNVVFSGTYDFGATELFPAHTEKWNPPAYVTVGGGVTFYPI